MMHIAEFLPASPSPLWTMVHQAGIRHVVAPLPAADEHLEAWSVDRLRRMCDTYSDEGFEVSVVEGWPP